MIRTGIQLFRSLLAFVLPPLVGMALFLACASFGRRRAINQGIAVVTRLGLGLAGIRLRVEGEQELLSTRPAIFIINH